MVLNIKGFMILVGAAILLEVLAGVSVFWALSVGIRV